MMCLSSFFLNTHSISFVHAMKNTSASLGHGSYRLLTLVNIILIARPGAIPHTVMVLVGESYHVSSSGLYKSGVLRLRYGSGKACGLVAA